ncbi:hypothetical protein LEP1GSC133_1752 [Leptospira borgpetersenii serovar Pomona str. 200901868]|uniref:Uncharacterized protein n=1 Tax=Leptospira borgpetersenii serovar Pomona str. 200901868 TaxID=1192866 RepID=M6W0S3_LEPBO|nr:hypothetical protein LEP1GSC133_1752 [Leptospira borgpetersenii serovar Pomona str. 200901868]
MQAQDLTLNQISNCSYYSEYHNQFVSKVRIFTSSKKLIILNSAQFCEDFYIFAKIAR